MDWDFDLNSSMLPGGTVDALDLVQSVLPVFIILANRKLYDVSESCGTNANTNREADAKVNSIYFYQKLLQHTISLYTTLTNSEALNSRILEADSPCFEALVAVLDELENCFRSSKRIRPEFLLLDVRIQKHEAYRKLMALRRLLNASQPMTKNEYLILNNVIEPYKKSLMEQERLFANLNIARDSIDSLQINSDYLDEPESLGSVRNYPRFHMKSHTRTLFEVLDAVWQCECKSIYHIRRKTRLDLIRYQLFNLSRDDDSTPLEANPVCFRMLFPTGQSNTILTWQVVDIEILEKLARSRKRKPEDREIGSTAGSDGLCQIIQATKRDHYPNLAIHYTRMFKRRTRVDISAPLNTPDGEFRTLKELLVTRHPGHESIMTSKDPQDRLVLSFVLCSYLFCFFSQREPWMQAALNINDICFQISRPHISLVDITKPYLTTDLAHLKSNATNDDDLSNPHAFPDILSVGIILLEIARGAVLELEDDGMDDCAAAMRSFETWKISQSTPTPTSVTRITTTSGVDEAITACIDPEKLESDGLYDRDVPDDEISTYILNKILKPLGQDLSDSYGIDLGSLDANLTQNDKVKSISNEDHISTRSNSRHHLTDDWYNRLDAVHHMFAYKRFSKIKKEEHSKTRVRVAILDTGFQMSPEIQQNHKEKKRILVDRCKSFLPDAASNLTSSWDIDEAGHGTSLGQIILRVAPNADLHIARVMRRNQDLSNLDSDTSKAVHESIAAAIRHASEIWKADIILMSFGFKTPIPIIEQAITAASKLEHDVPIFFAATSNDSAHGSIAWPARMQLVIAISSTDADGGPSGFSPVDHGCDSLFYALGENIPVKVTNKNSSCGYDMSYKSGTSYAAAIAVGLASNLVSILRLTVMTYSEKDSDNYAKVAEKVGQSDGMVKILRHCMLKKHQKSGQMSLLPWDFLHPSQLIGNRILSQTLRTLDSC